MYYIHVFFYMFLRFSLYFRWMPASSRSPVPEGPQGSLANMVSSTWFTSPLLSLRLYRPLSLDNSILFTQIMSAWGTLS